MNEITRVFVVRRKDKHWQGKKLPLDNDQLERFADSVLLKDDKRLISFEKANDMLVPPKKYFIRTGDTAYQLDLVKPLYNFLVGII